MRAVDEAQRERYREAVAALAARVVDAVERADTPDDEVQDRALRALARIERDIGSEYAWVFRDPSVLEMTDNLFEALDAQPDGRRMWLHADLASAVAAVARFDVVSEALEQISDLRSDDEEGEPAAPGEA